MESGLLRKIAVSMTPGINAGVIRNLSARGITLDEFFSMNMPELVDSLGSGVNAGFQNASRDEALFRARKELEFIKRHSIRVLYLLDDDYPVLLREIPDAPVVLYVLGRTNLDSVPAVSLVGTRRCTGYGQSFCSSFVKDLSPYYPDSLIVSGLAYGIDTAAHCAALENGIATVAVMAHGLDTIYPSANRELARRIVAQGGAIISEYPTGTRAYQKNFLQRNRIVAGLSEASVIVESEIRGGAMSTANYAFSYNREVFAVPGRYNDIASSGCNMLIARNKAHLYSSIAGFMNVMNWEIPALGTVPPQKNLFPELEGDLETVYNVIKKSSGPLSIDEIHTKTNLSMPKLMSALTDLEFEGILIKLPGARYEIC